MHLRRLTLKDFRAFRFASVSLPSAGQVLVYGPNNSGKSSLVSALDLIAGREPPSLAWRGSTDAAVLAEFELTETEARAMTAQMQPPEADFFELGGLKAVRVEYRGGAGGSRPLISSVDIQTTEGKFAQIFQLVPRWPNSSPPFFDINALETNMRLGPKTASSLQGRVQNVQDPTLHQVPELVPLANLLEVWRDRFFHFSASRRVVSKDVQLAAETVLMSDGENLAKVLVSLQHNHPKRWQELSQTIDALVPNLGLLQIPTVGTQSQVGFLDESANQFLNLEALGSGVTQLLLALTLGVMQSEASVLVLEEPETGLHPAAQHALADLLREWSKERLILITTHSTAFLPAVAETAVKTLLVERADGRSSVRELDAESMHSIGDALGLRLLDVLVADRILVVEGPTDVDILHGWFPSIRRDPRVAVVVSGGGNAAKGAAQFSRWLEQADGPHARTVTFLRDQDELSVSQLEELKSLNVVKVLSVREIENYLLSGEVLATYFASQGVHVSAETLEKQMQEASYDLLPSVVLRAAARRQPAIRLCDDAARTALVKKGAGMSEFAADVLSRLPNRRSLKAGLHREWREVEADYKRRWQSEWRDLAPGADVLKVLFMRHLNRGFSKSIDGPALSRLFARPPAELAAILGGVLTVTND